MTKKISQVEKLAKMQDDLNANKTNVTCTSATVTSSNKVSESANDKLSKCESNGGKQRTKRNRIT
jgi:hypothetical protein